METKCTKLESMQTIGNLVWQVQHNTLTLDNSPNGIVSCTKPTIARIEKLVVFLQNHTCMACHLDQMKL